MKTCWSKFCKRVAGCTNWVTILIVLLVVICVAISAFALDISISSRNALERFETQTEGGATGITETELQFYRELNDKTDDAINRLITLVGVFVGVVAVFSIFLAFRAPRDIDRRMSELDERLLSTEKIAEEANQSAAMLRESAEKAKEAAEEAKYQAGISGTSETRDELEQIKQLSMIISEYPKKVDAYFHRAMLKAKIGNQAEAIKDMNQARKNGADESLYCNQMGIMYSLFKNTEKAVECFSKSLEINPNVYDYNNRADEYMKYLCSDDAIEYLVLALDDVNKAIELEPDYARTYFRKYNICLNLEVLYKNKGETHKSEEARASAIDSIDEAYRLAPNYNDIKITWDREYKG